MDQRKPKVLRGGKRLTDWFRIFLDNPDIRESWVYAEAAKEGVPVFKDGETLVAVDTELEAHYLDVASGRKPGAVPRPSRPRKPAARPPIGPRRRRVPAARLSG